MINNLNAEVVKQFYPASEDDEEFEDIDDEIDEELEEDDDFLS